MTGWLWISASGVHDAATHIGQLDENLLGPATEMTASGIRARSPRATSSPVLDTLLREILMEERIEDEAKVALVCLPWMVAHPDSYLGALPRHLHDRLREALRIDERWLHLAEPVAQELLTISECLLQPEELVLLRRRRQEAEENARIEEERRIQEERDRRAREEAEKARQEQERADREQALRRALAGGRDRQAPSGFTMTGEIEQVFRAIEGRAKLLFVTGRPGTGKSTLIRALRERLRSRNAAFLSFTGTAALNIGGQTINSFFMMPPRLLELGWRNDRHSFRERAQALETLVVDEVSMLRPDMLDAMDGSLRYARRDDRPFGGVQLVLVGDLYQLPPIIENDPAVQDYYDRVYGGQRFFYAARAFSGRQPEMLELTSVFRQAERDYLELLGKIREGSVSGDDLDLLNERLRSLPDFTSRDYFVTVMPHRATAARENEQALGRLPGEPRSYPARLEGGAQRPAETEREGSDKYPADLRLELKPGAQVMLIKNDDGKQWVNGDMGIVESLGDDRVRVTTWSGTWEVERAKWPIVKYEIDPDTHRLTAVEHGSFHQFPLRLAWATTIHKMQGQTLDRLRIDLTGGSFEAGMTYVALSRCRTLEGMRLTRPVTMADVLASAEVRDYYSRQLAAARPR